MAYNGTSSTSVCMWLAHPCARFTLIWHAGVHTVPILFLLFSIFIFSKYIQVVELYPC
jgi:hypothetical protein